MSTAGKTNLRISDIYAQAFYETARQENILADVKSDLDVINNIFIEFPQLNVLLLSPYFTRAYKTQLLEKLFSGRFSYLTSNFLLVVAKHNRFKFLPQIIDSFTRLWDQYHGLVPVSITLSQKLDDLRIQKLCDEISAAVGRKTRLTQTIIDPSIIGGIIIHYGDKVIDNTIKTRLLKAVQTVTNKQKWETTINEI